MAIEINVVNGIVNISTNGDVPRSYYGAVGASGSVMPMKAHLLGNVTEVSWISAQEYAIPAGDYVVGDQYSSSGLGTGFYGTFSFVDSATSGYTNLVSVSGIATVHQNGKYKIGDSITVTITAGIQVVVTVKSLAYERVLIKIGGDFYEENWYDLVINGTSPTDFNNALSLLSSALSSAGSPAPYKVYTALLTQYGGSNLEYINDGLLTIGVTYELFDEPLDGWDFTNVGAPNNLPGTKFVATGTTPNNWGTQSPGNSTLGYNTGAPVVTVLENTIGNIWFTYIGMGMYGMISDNLFTPNKTIGFAGGQQFGNASGDPVFGMYQNSINEIEIDTPSGNNDRLIGAPIEIRIYS